MVIDTRPSPRPYHKCEDVLIDGHCVAMIHQEEDTNSWRVILGTQPDFYMEGSKEEVLAEIAHRKEKESCPLT